ncbi:hypothetical protein JCGZ_09633 [Jatropha curcas]|uniref:Uncharacterized protein n=1 Tax=Jatropha curcas TaxID=180498 RepID=A0A067LLV8_JATCU|nr:uncharacterized protein LOC105641904 [Jatropha curcas]KDP45384.1 hypothetical protein JCGZ_09633 [Jatropha curcas]
MSTQDIQERDFGEKRCCFWIPFLSEEPSRSSVGSVFWERINSIESSHTATNKEEPWWKRGWKKMKEWSEIVAGPKWKTLIRKIGRKRQSNSGKQGTGKFHYDPLSYALNFDEGPRENGHFDEDLMGREFSSRYSLPPSCKSSLDFDNDKEAMIVT